MVIWKTPIMNEYFLFYKDMKPIIETKTKNLRNNQILTLNP